MGNKRVPEVRFEGFSGEWEERKLGDFTESYSGGTPSAGNKLYYGGSIPFIRSAEINSKSTELFITEDGLNNSSAKMVEKGDILYALYGATSGEVGIAKIHGAINQAILAIKPKFDDDSYFIIQWLKKQKSTIINTYLQGGQGNLSGSIVKDLIIPLPTNKDEQIQVGSFCKHLDDTIALHQQELTTLKQTKQGFLQKMFPKEGKSVPEVRFSGFTGDWEQRKLREMLAEPVTDGPHETPKLEESGIPFISVDAIVDNQIDFDRKRGYISEETDELYSKKYRPQYHDVFLVKSGSTVGKTAIVETKERFNIWSPLAAMRVGEVSDPYFLYFLLQTRKMQNQVKDKASSGTQPNLGMRELEKFHTQITPNLEEQKKIGAFFQQLDNLITLHQRELEALKKTKKAFLQKMFV
ncbi:restriction endonuclease subunit S [Bacillus velezensis]|uniref:restriction endonuclease subunit S n=1 Tax=Bacillus velezensis TaxID=492670 RepID=UPI003EBFD0EF